MQVLPLNHPLRVAEEVATVDHISQGRFDFGVGRSGSPRAYDVYGVPYEESQARFEEALTIIREAWKGEPFSYEGTFPSCGDMSRYIARHGGLERKVAFGSAAGLIDRLSQLQEQLTLNGVVAELNPGGLIPVELERESLRILAHQVVPAFK